MQIKLVLLLAASTFAAPVTPTAESSGKLSKRWGWGDWLNTFPLFGNFFNPGLRRRSLPAGTDSVDQLTDQLLAGLSIDGDARLQGQTEQDLELIDDMAE